MDKLLTRITRINEAIAAIILAVIFITFILQVFMRYAAKMVWLMPIPPIADWMADLEPLRWSVYLISLLWVWLIFFSCAFIVRDKDHVVFDILFNAIPVGGRKILGILGAIIMIVFMTYSLPPTYEALWESRLMNLKKLQTLRVPFTGDKIAMKWLFFPYIMLMLAVIVRYGWALFNTIKSGPLKDAHEKLDQDLGTKAGDR